MLHTWVGWSVAPACIMLEFELEDTLRTCNKLETSRNNLAVNMRGAAI